MSIFKNMSVILFISIKNSYIKFRTWIHKKINHTERKKQRLKEEARQRAEKEAKLKREEDLLANGVQNKRAKIEVLSSDRPIITTTFQNNSNSPIQRKRVCIFPHFFFSKHQGKEIRKVKYHSESFNLMTLEL